MKRIQPSSRTRRPGFTLIEMMLVVGIVVILASILVPVALRFTERSSVSTGISMLQRYLAEAKSRAIAERKPSGIRLLAMRPEDRTTSAGLGLPWYDRVEFIEAPGDFCEGFVWCYLPPGPRVINVPAWTRDPTAPNVETYAGVDPPTQVISGYTLPPGIPLIANRLYGAINNVNSLPGMPASPLLKQVIPFSFSPTANMQPLVEIDDVVELNGVSQPYRVIGVNFNVGIVPTYLELDRPLVQDVPMPLNGKPNYRVIRQPRPIGAKTAVKLPGGVVVDLAPGNNPIAGLQNSPMPTGDRSQDGQIWMRGLSYGAIVPINWAGGNPIAPRYVDILFNEAGQLVPTSRQFAPNESFAISGEGLVYLWTHQAGSPNSWAAGSPTAAEGNADNQALITINARTGQIASFPIDQDAASGNPWSNAQRGRAQGVGGL